MARVPWAITTIVSCLPVLVLGMGTELAHMLRADAAAAADNRTGLPVVQKSRACVGRGRLGVWNSVPGCPGDAETGAGTHFQDGLRTVLVQVPAQAAGPRRSPRSTTRHPQLPLGAVSLNVRCIIRIASI